MSPRKRLGRLRGLNHELMYDGAVFEVHAYPISGRQDEERVAVCGVEHAASELVAMLPSSPSLPAVTDLPCMTAWGEDRERALGGGSDL